RVRSRSGNAWRSAPPWILSTWLTTRTSIRNRTTVGLARQPSVSRVISFPRHASCSSGCEPHSRIYDCRHSIDDSQELNHNRQKQREGVGDSCRRAVLSFVCLDVVSHSTDGKESWPAHKMKTRRNRVIAYIVTGILLLMSGVS